jgi:hypothetical protein
VSPNRDLYGRGPPPAPGDADADDDGAAAITYHYARRADGYSSLR